MKSQVGERILIRNAVPITSITSLAEGYLINCRCEGKSRATIDNYQDKLKRFIWFCQVNGYPDEPQKLSANHIRQFLWYLSSESNRWVIDHPSSRKPASHSTVNNYYRVLNTFFSWLEQEGLIGNNPVARIKTPRFDYKVVQALNPNEIKRILDVCSGKSMLDVRNKAVLSILLDTGLRVSELAHISLEDVDVKTGAILVKHGKGGKQRVVRIGSKAQKALWRYVTIYRRGDSDRLFLKTSGEPLDVIGIKILIRRMTDKTSVKVYSHKLRHTFAINYLRNGGDVFTLQYLLGHSTIQMTQRYLQSLNAQDAITAHRKFSPLDNMKV